VTAAEGPQGNERAPPGSPAGRCSHLKLMGWYEDTVTTNAQERAAQDALVAVAGARGTGERKVGHG